MADTLNATLNRVAGRNTGIMDADTICIPTKEVTKLTVIITPEVAQRLIDQTDLSLQRKRSRSTIQAYANDMLEGRWALNHSVIQQDVNGNMIDGQHRLLGCIVAQRPFITDMVKGVIYEDVMDTIDTGKNRSKADILSLSVDGIEKYQSTIAGAIDFIFNFSNGRYADSQNHSLRFTNHQIKEWLDANQTAVYQLAEYAKEAHRLKGNLIPHKMSVGLRYIFKRINSKKADEFFDQLIYGQNMSQDSPIFFIRERMQNSKISKSKQHRLSYRDQLMLMVKAWNDYYLDGTMKGSFYKTADVQMPPLEGLDGVRLYNLPKGWKAQD